MCKKRIFHMTVVFISCIICVGIVYAAGVMITRKNSRNTADARGSFTLDKADSYDKKYYALAQREEERMAILIYESENDSLVFSFYPVRAIDFWGICWESNSYNIWIQSGDVGVVCYSCYDNQWRLNKEAKRPDDIVSKYDE